MGYKDVIWVKFSIWWTPEGMLVAIMGFVSTVIDYHRLGSSQRDFGSTVGHLRTERSEFFNNV